eukprot:gene25134-biopygen16479
MSGEKRPDASRTRAQPFLPALRGGDHERGVRAREHDGQVRPAPRQVHGLGGTKVRASGPRPARARFSELSAPSAVSPCCL